MLVIHIAVAEF